jgi:HK97 family phage prohead protease
MPKPLPDELEQRDAIHIDLRADPEKDGWEGYASTWWTVDSYGTAMAPGAFKKTVKERASELFVLWNHDPNAIIGEPLSLKEDKTGLFTDTAAITEVQIGADALAYVRRLGDRLGMSIGFNTIRDRSGEDDDPLDYSTAPEWAKKMPKNEVRVITEARLWEYSLVTFPANRKARPTNVRADVEADLIQSLMEELRAGTLSDERLAALSDLVAAYQEAAAPVQDEEPEPRTAPKARRDVLIELAALEAQYGRYAELSA